MHPILFSFGPIRLYSYGLLVAIGVLSAVLLLRRNAKRISIDPNVILDLAIVTVTSGFIGARIFYVLQYWDYFIASPLEIVKIWEGGIVLYGGLVGGLLGFLIFIKVKRLPFVALLDLFVPALALAQGFGRIGCFLNGCCFGLPTALPWGVSFPFSGHPVHPTQLYEAVFCFALAALLFFLWQRRPRTGTVAASYFILYPTGRFLFEFVRGDQAKFFLHLTLHQWFSLVLIAVTLVLVLRGRLVRDGKKAIDRPA